MGVTTIKRIENRTRATVILLNKENANTQGHGTSIPPGGSIAVDMWVPWAPTLSDFPVHHLEIQVDGRTRYWIWQAVNADGDFIRFSTDGAWHAQGEHVYGYAGVATNLLEALGGALFTGDAAPLGQLALGERAIVVLESHFETVPIAPKLPVPGITAIKRVENQSQQVVQLHDVETPSAPGDDTAIPPGTGRDVSMFIPWVTDATAFTRQHLELRLAGQTRYWIWQAAHADGDYVRVATSPTWTAEAPRVNGIAATGISPADWVFTGDRILVVRDDAMELWPYPAFLDGLLDTVRPLLRGARLIEETAMVPPPGTVPSVPKKSAVAFSVAGLPSDAYKRGQRGARYLYNDSGKRYEFSIDANGLVVATHPDGTQTTLDKKAWSYTRVRGGEKVALPPFDLIAASGGRVFAKVKDADQFYFTTMDHIFVHAPREAPADAPEFVVPSTYFKLDPQYNQPNARVTDLLLTTDNVYTGHPASERMPVFRHVLVRQLVDMMLACVEPETWQLLDFRPPQNVIGLAIRDAAVQLLPLALAMAGGALHLGPLTLLAQAAYFAYFKNVLSESLRKYVEAGAAPPQGIPIYTPVTYLRDDGTRIAPPAIKYEKVLAIGVGHVHLHQQYERITGGEIQPVLSGEDYASMYRFFNGPVADGDGYIDGTCNFYALVKHAQTDQRPFSLLFQDEQLYFSQRWRLVDPDDHAGLMFAVTTDLSNARYGWNPATYWCPFRAGHINDNSRLAVAAQVVLVTGSDTATGVWRIYSINFSWATIDRTWRWRDMPPVKTVETYEQAAVDAGDERVMDGGAERIYPQSIRLREDMILHLRGTSTVPGLGVVAGHWYQRYLPADNTLATAPTQLVAGQMPSIPFRHPWKFLPDSVFQLADTFSHFRVYDVVNSRTQYYDMTPMGPADVAALDVGRLEPWIDDTRQLFVSQWKFRWEDAPVHPGVDPLDPPSLFNPDTRLRIVRRGVRWIAMHWDKRDDDLIPFERLPMQVTLKQGSAVVRVTIGAHHRVEQPPAVRNAYVWIEPNGVAGVAFDTIAPSADFMYENVSRVRVAALEADPVNPTRLGRVVPLLDLVTEGVFTPANISLYEYRWMPTADGLAALRSYCSFEKEMQYGTSIWFEDVVGHVSPPEWIWWMRSPAVVAVATPSAIPLGVPTPVTVHATDARTGASLTGGTVKVDGQVVGSTDAPFTYTFTTHVEGGGFDPETHSRLPSEIIYPSVTVTVPGSRETEVPLTFYVPQLNVRTEPASFPIGPAVQITVRAEDAQAHAPVAGRVKLAGVDVAATNTPFVYTFPSSGIQGVVSASGYPDKSFAVRLYIPQIRVWAEPSLLPTGRLLQVTVRAVDTTTGLPVAGRVKVNGQDVAATNTPFTYTFGVTPPDGVVSAPYYLDAAVAWPLSVSTLSLSTTPYPATLGRVLQVTVRTVDAQTGATVTGRVKIDGTDVAATNTTFPYTFRSHRVGVSPNIEIVYPAGVVSAFGYYDTAIDFGFP